jgi:hypothetical protein
MKRKIKETPKMMINNLIPIILSIFIPIYIDAGISQTLTLENIAAAITHYSLPVFINPKIGRK